MSIVRLARPEIQALSAYEAAAQVEGTVRLNANESPKSSPFDKFRRPLNRYPEVRPQWLQQALATRFGCAANQLLVTRGSSEAIDLIIRSFCRAGLDNIVIPSPSFSLYRHYAAIQGAEVVAVPALAERDFRIDIDGLLAACTRTTRVIFVCSPNNPTGSVIPRDDIVRLIDGRAEQSVVVVDEAYIEFGCEHSVIELLNRHPNLLVLRTLSKALAFAGARCGAVAGARDVINLLNAVQAPYALATPVVECIEDGLQSEQLAQAEQSVREVVAERARLMATIDKFGFVQRVWPSAANFFLIRVSNATLLMQHCMSQNVLLRRFGGNLSDCIRITVGSTADNDKLVRALHLLNGKR